MKQLYYSIEQFVIWTLGSPLNANPNLALSTSLTSLLSLSLNPALTPNSNPNTASCYIYLIVHKGQVKKNEATEKDWI